MVAQALEDAAEGYQRYPEATMVTVDTTELKSCLDRCLQLVRQGQPVRITDHGKLIGCILPFEKPSESFELAQLSRLLEPGGLTLGKGNLRRHWKPTALKSGASIAKMVAQDRR